MSRASNPDLATTTTASSSSCRATSATGTAAAAAAAGRPRGIPALGRGFGAAPGASAASMQYSSTARRAAAAAGGVRGPLLAPPAAATAAARRLVATSAVAAAATPQYARQLQPKADLMQQQELQQGVSTPRPEMYQQYGTQQQDRGISIQDILQQEQQYHMYGSATPAPSGAAYPLQRITAVRLSPFAIRTAPPSSASSAAGAVAAVAASGPCVELQVLLPQLSSLPAAVAWECRLRWLQQVSRGMQLLHQHKVVHGCITADNVLLAPGDQSPASTPVAAVDQTQLSSRQAQLSMLQPFKDVLSPNLARPLALSPPELLSQGAALSAASDVYTFGLLMVQLLTGWQAEQPKGGPELKKHIATCHQHLSTTGRPISPDLIQQAVASCQQQLQPPHAGQVLQLLLLRCLDPKPEMRPNAQEILQELTTLQTAFETGMVQVTY